MKSRAKYFRRWRAANKEVRRAKDRKRYADNREKFVARQGTYRDKQRLPGGKIHAFIEWQNNLKAGPCVDCGCTFPPCAMDWDHVRGEKKFNLSTMRGYCLSENLKARVLEEIAKCDLVCACCHRIRTEARRVAGL